MTRRENPPTSRSTADRAAVAKQSTSLPLRAWKLAQSPLAGSSRQSEGVAGADSKAPGHSRFGHSFSDVEVGALTSAGSTGRPAVSIQRKPVWIGEFLIEPRELPKELLLLFLKLGTLPSESEDEVRLALQEKISAEALPRILRGSTDDPDLDRIHRSIRLPVLLPQETAPAEPTKLEVYKAELKRIGARIAEMAEEAPERGVNMWQVQMPGEGPEIYLLGTMHHSKILRYMPLGNQLVRFIREKQFSRVYTEIEAEIPSVEQLGSLEEQFGEQLGPEPDRATAQKAWIRWKRREQVESTALVQLPIANYKLDDVYEALALEGEAEPHALETDETRAEAQSRLDEKRGGPSPKPYDQERMTGEDPNRVEQAVITGNEKEHWQIYTSYLMKGEEIQGIEERNDYWMQSQKFGEYSTSKPTLWIVGASHLPSLLARFDTLGAKYAPQVFKT